MARSIVLWVVILVVVCSCDSSLPPPNNLPNQEPNTWSERWECYDLFREEVKLGTLIVVPDGSHGWVDFDGIVAGTQFSIEGIERRWDWDYGANGTSNSAIVLGPGTIMFGHNEQLGRYCNFRYSSDGMAEASYVFKCKRR